MIPVDRAFIETYVKYDPLTGIFTRLRTDNPTGRINKDGYIEIQLGKRRLLAHRLAWMLIHGEWPPSDIDHADRVKSNNRISNLRIITASQQCQNTDMPPLNTSGKRGVHWDTKSGKWRARIRHANVKHCLGYYENLEDAEAAYLGAARLLHTHNPLIQSHHYSP